MGRIVERVCYGLLVAMAAAFIVAYFVVTGPYFSFQSEAKEAQRPNEAFVQIADLPPFYFVRGDFDKDDAERVEAAYAKGCSVKTGGKWSYREMPDREVGGRTRTAIFLCPMLNYEERGNVELAFVAFKTKAGEILLLTDEIIVKMRPGHDLWHIVASMGVAASRPMKDAERTYVITLSPRGHANPMERSRELFWRAEVEWAQPNFVRIWSR